MSSFILSWKNNTNHFSCQKNLISIQFLLIFFHVYFWTGRTSKTTSKFKVPVHSIRIFSHKPRWISKKLFFKPVFSNSLSPSSKNTRYLMLKNIWICRWFELWFDVNYRKITIYVRTFEQALLLDLTNKKRAKIVLLVGFDNWNFGYFAEIFCILNVSRHFRNHTTKGMTNYLKNLPRHLGAIGVECS